MINVVTMSGQGETGAKTENATPKRLRDARKKGDVVKSKDISSTLGLAFTAALFWLAFSTSLNQLAELLTSTLQIPNGTFNSNLRLFGTQAISVFLNISAIILIPIALFGMLVEFIQAGPVFAMGKVRPKLSHLNPTAGVKRIFSSGNLIELVKSIAKAMVLFCIAYIVIRDFLPELMLVPGSQPISIALALKAVLSQLLLWTLAIFTGIMLLDVCYQRFAYAKKMRMSINDLKQEQKDSEGDSALKQQRKHMHKEYNEHGAAQAAGKATALVVNPTHVAIAIHYDRDDCPVPIVSAKGEDDVARQMRHAANDNHVPVLRNELLARTLLANASEGEAVPRGLFDIVAQVILWATKTSSVVSRELGDIPSYTELTPPPEPPGENLTVYPKNFDSTQLVSNNNTATLQRT